MGIRHTLKRIAIESLKLEKSKLNHKLSLIKKARKNPELIKDFQHDKVLDFKEVSDKQFPIPILAVSRPSKSILREFWDNLKDMADYNPFSMNNHKRRFNNMEENNTQEYLVVDLTTEQETEPISNLPTMQDFQMVNPFESLLDIGL